MAEIDVIRTYKVTIDDEVVERYSDTSERQELLKGLCTTATRQADEGNLNGWLYLINDGEGPYWDDCNDEDALDGVAFEVEETWMDVTGA